MKIPNKVKILGIRYTTKKNCVNIKKLGHLGMYNHVDSLISLSSDKHITNNKQNETYIHEICHGINDKLSIFPDDTEEDIVNRLSNCLYMALLDNEICFNHKKLPKSLKIGGLFYNVCLDEDLFNSTGKQFFIENRLTTITIDISDDTKKEPIESNFLMSMIATLDYQFHIFDPDNVSQIDVFSNAFYQVLKDNKELCFCES